MTEEEPPRFEVRVTADSHFGWIRTRMAVERTAMAWIRTGVSLIGFGFTIVQFFQRLNSTDGVVAATRPQAPRQMGLALIAAGILAMIVATIQYRSVVKYLWSDSFKPVAGFTTKGAGPIFSQSPVMAITIAITLIGIFAFFAVLMRVV